MHSACVSMFPSRYTATRHISSFVDQKHPLRPQDPLTDSGSRHPVRRRGLRVRGTSRNSPSTSNPCRSLSNSPAPTRSPMSILEGYGGGGTETSQDSASPSCGTRYEGYGTVRQTSRPNGGTVFPDRDRSHPAIAGGCAISGITEVTDQESAAASPIAFRSQGLQPGTLKRPRRR
jgi:hypothetical protein